MLNKKKIISTLLSVIMVFCVFAALPFSASAAQTSGNFEYELFEDGTSEITAYNGSEADLTIPQSIDGYTVTSIGESAFEGSTSLTSVTIPDSVTVIDNGAFAGCTSLTTVSMPDSLVIIGDGSFNSCESLTDITFPNSLLVIGNYSFTGCTSLTKINIPDSVLAIGESVFMSCTGLADISLPDNAMYIGVNAFDDTQWYESQADGAVYIGHYFYRYKGDMPENTKVEIKNGTIGIAGGAFLYCSNLIDVSIPDGLVTISDGAFILCEGLTDIVLPDSVTDIGNYAFSFCAGLTDINIPDSVTYIGQMAFAYCTSLTDISIPNSVETIDAGAFIFCSGLTEITVPRSVTEIGEYALGYYQTYDSDSDTLIPVAVDGFKIKGYKGSAAEIYATENGFEFVQLSGGGILGDVDHSEEVDAADATLVLQYYAGIISADSEGFDISVADVNADSEINASDATMILQLYSGIITRF